MFRIVYIVSKCHLKQLAQVFQKIRQNMWAPPAHAGETLHFHIKIPQLRKKDFKIPGFWNHRSISLHMMFQMVAILFWHI